MVKPKAGFVTVIIEVWRIVTVIGCFGIERMRYHEINAAHLMLVGQPLHLRIGELLVITAKNFTHGNVIFFAVNV